MQRAGLLAVGLGCALRLHGLAVHSFWYDEAASLAVAQAPDLGEALLGDRHPPLFFVLLRAWQAVFGTSDAALRLLPATVGCASLVGLHVVARRLLPPWPAIAATALFAVAPFQVWYAQELRMYALLELGTVLALLGAVADGRRARCVLALVGAAVAFGSHYFGFLVPALLLPMLVLRAPGAWQREGWRQWGLPWFASVAGVLAWVPWLVVALPRQLATPWAFQARSSARDLLELPVRWFVVLGELLPPWLVYAIAAGVAAGLARTAWAAWRGERLARAVLASLALAAAALLAAFVVMPPNLQPFYLIGVTPVVVLAVARGRVVPLLLAVVCLAATVVLRQQNAKEDYRTAVAELAQHWVPGDVVVAVTGTPELLSQAGLRHYLRDRPDVLAAVRPLPDLLRALETGERTKGRVQVLLRDRPYAAPELARLQAKAQPVHTGELRRLLRHLTFAIGR